MTETALLLDHAKVWTGNGFARSVAVRGGRIESLDAVPSGRVKRIDLGGRLVVPGFIDSHVHFVMGSRQLSDVQLRDSDSIETFAQRIAEHSRKLGPGRWVTGGGWDEQRWRDPVLPTRQAIDEVTRESPVFVTRLDLHMGLANTHALRLAGVTRDTPDRAGGVIVRDRNGEPTGVLKDSAIRLVADVIPTPTIEERMNAMRVGLREAARRGVTACGDMAIAPDAFDDFRAWQRLDRAGELTARVWMYPPLAAWRRFVDASLERSFGSDRLRLGGLKGFSDGSLGSSTAAFHEPYRDEPCNCGLLMRPMEDGSMAEWVAGADENELQLAIHAIGDRANERVLALFESRADAATRRFRIEHAQHLNADLVRRFAASKVIASMQPYHAVDDGRWAASKIGEERCAWAFPYRSLLDAGVVVAFGSDWPVAPLDPIAGIHAAVTRETIDGAARWVPEQATTVEEALRGFTSGGAYAVFAEREIGTIAPGFRADLAVLSDDLFTIDPNAIRDVQVDLTIFDGEIVFEA